MPVINSSVLLGEPHNHVTVTESNLERSFQFYTSVLGFEPKAKWKNGAYLLLGDLWYVLSCGNVERERDYSHIAFSATKESFLGFEQAIERHGIQQWKDNTSEGDSLYFLDPDGRKLEVHVGDIESRIASMKGRGYDGLQLY